VKFIQPRPYADPDAAVREILEIDNAQPVYMDGRLLPPKLNWPMLAEYGVSSTERRVGIDRVELLVVIVVYYNLAEAGKQQLFDRNGRKFGNHAITSLHLVTLADAFTRETRA
jgi:hypothetical protein